MFEPGAVLIDLLVEKLEADFREVYGSAEPDCANTIGSVGREVLEKISGCNALYHNVNHTMLVTLVGQEILQGRHSLGPRMSPETWLNFVVSLLCHDVGFVPDLCRADRAGVYASGVGGETVSLPPEATDASLAPYHVDRGALFVRERFSDHAVLDAEVIAANIDRTRFPVPEGEEHQCTDDAPGLVRAADLLGQMAEPHARRRYPALYYELEETGVNRKLGYASPQDLRADLPRFFSKIVSRYCAAATRFLEATEDGREWLANIDAELAAAREIDRASVAP